MQTSNPNIALVADWLTSPGGAEQVIHTWHTSWPTAPIYTTIHDPSRLPEFNQAKIHTTYLQRLPFSRKKHPYYLPLMPTAIESLDLRGYDIVLSSSHSCAKGIITKPETLHISYCHTPPRYIWEPAVDNRLTKYRWPISTYTTRLLTHLRTWDRLAADRVDYFLANSKYIATRIQKYYRRKATVIYPPVQTERFTPTEKFSDYYLAIGRLIPYKRFDLSIKACTALDLPLKVVGTGPELRHLQSIAGPKVEFLGHVPSSELPALYSHARAVLNPQLEDFGITAIEAQAAGRPVIAYGQGGACETVINEKTGLFFKEQTVDSLAQTLRNFDPYRFNPTEIHNHAQQFSTPHHLTKLQKFLEEKLLAHRRGELDPSLHNNL